MSLLSAATNDEDGDIIKTLQARVADLEAQLYAVGAGGVGKLTAQGVEDSALLGNIESPFNACMHQEHCKWKHQAHHPEQRLDIVPAGWKLVPVEPTTKMIDAARSQSSFPAGVWRAMLAAAPHPPVVEQPQGEQEPVAYYVMNGAALFQLFRSKSQADALAYDLQKRHDLSGSLAHFHVVPLYTHPQPQRQPLTDEQIFDLAEQFGEFRYGDAQGHKRIDFARAIERAHGIGGEA